MVVGDAVWPWVRESIGTSAYSDARRPISEITLSIVGSTWAAGGGFERLFWRGVGWIRRRGLGFSGLEGLGGINKW